MMSKEKPRQAAPGTGRSQMPGNLQFILEQAIALLQQGQPASAEVYFRQVLAAVPQHPDALQFLGVIEYQKGRFAAAAELLQSAIDLAPEAPGLHCNLGLAQQELGRPELALASYDRALALMPKLVEALNNRGNVLRELGRLAESAASYRRALSIRPDFVEALYNLGFSLVAQEKAEEALGYLARCLRTAPGHVGALGKYGIALMALKRPKDALACFERVLAVTPDDAEIHFQRGNALLLLDRQEEAAVSYRQAANISPDAPEAYFNLGTVLLDLRRHEEAIDAFNRALELRPLYVEALYNKGDAQHELLRHEDAVATYKRLLQYEPAYKYTLGKLFNAWQFCCNWTSYYENVETLAGSMEKAIVQDMPFSFLAVSGDPALQLLCAKAYTTNKYPASAAPLCASQGYAHDKIRIAYVSADFRDHPLCYLLAGVFETHDRELFEIIGIGLGAPDGSTLGQRVEAAFDRFIDVSRMKDQEVAALIRDLEVDIAVHLTGYTQNCRMAIFAQRPAPVQVNYLGFPGTTGADYIDYIIADAFVIPEGNQQHYAEKVAYLPECFQGNDDKRAISDKKPARKELGLPETGFVFCAFNNTYKFTPPLFAIWMRLLENVPGSVLWFASDDVDVQRNLRAEAGKHGVAPHRLVFSPRVKYADHLARFQLADLFLDTLPFNAGTTASDALWAGVPVLTCAGEAFAARMAGSLLQAVCLPELVTNSLDEYEAKARQLATTPTELAEIRARLACNRLEAPLFNTKRFCRHLEMAYRHMWAAYQRGEAPATFRFDRLD